MHKPLSHLNPITHLTSLQLLSIWVKTAVKKRKVIKRI